MKFLLVLFPVVLFSQNFTLSIKTPHALVMNAKTGAVLFEKNAYDLVFPASTTKIATALYVLHSLEEPSLDNLVTCPYECLKSVATTYKISKDYNIPLYWLENDGTSYGLRPFEQISIRALLFGLMLSSGNDAANVLAYHVGGDILTFMSGLNEYLRTIGCKTTYFCNPHGLHAPWHQTTAYEMALIAKEALKYPLLREIVSTMEYERPKTNKSGSKLIKQSNRLLKQGEFFYPNAFGMKTGYTSCAKSNLVATASNGLRELIVVLHSSEDKKQRYRDAIALFDAVFNETEVFRLLFNKYENVFTNGELDAHLHEDLFLNYYPSEEPTITTNITWLDLDLPIEKDQLVGYVEVSNNKGAVIEKAPLFAINEIAKPIFSKSLIYFFVVSAIIGALYYARYSRRSSSDGLLAPRRRPSRQPPRRK